MKTQSFRVQPLRGIDRRWIAKPDSARRIEDMTWTERDSWRECGGLRQIYLEAGGGNPFSGLGRIAGLHWFSQHNGARQWTLFITGDGKFRYFNPSDRTTPYDFVRDVNDDLFDGSDRDLTTITAPWQKSQAQAWGGRLYLANGYDEPMVFNGRYVDRAGFDTRPGTPVARPLDKTKADWRITIASIGLGRVADSGTLEGAHRYVATFVNERGQESPPSEPSESAIIENDTDGKSFILVDIPLGGSNVVARRIYRTRNLYDSNGEPLDLGYGGDFYFLREIQDNITDSFEDAVPDTGLGSLLEPLDFGIMPTSVSLLAIFKNTMFMSGFPDNNIRFSAPLFPEVFPEDNVIEIGDDDMGLVTAMRPTKNALVVFKQRGIYLIKGDPVNGFYADTLTRDDGCIAPNSVAEIPGLGMAFLGQRGISLLQGALENTGTPTAVVELSTNVEDLIEAVNTSAAPNVASAVLHREKEYWLAAPTDGGADNDKVFVFHYATGQWSTREGFPINTMLETRDHRGYLLIGSNDASNKEGILVYSHGWQNKLNSESITPVYQTVSIAFGDFYKSAQPKFIIPYCVTNGNNDLTVNFRVNHEVTDALPADLSKDQQDPNDELPVYNTALWGSSYTWPSQRPTALRFDISATHRGPVREISFIFGAEDRKIELLAYDIETGLGEQRLIKPLNLALGPDKE